MAPSRGQFNALAKHSPAYWIVAGAIAGSLITTAVVPLSRVTASTAPRGTATEAGADEAATATGSGVASSSAGALGSSDAGPSSTGGQLAGLPSQTDETAPADQPISSSAQGVTPTTISLALLLIDLGGAGGFGVAVAGASVQDQRAAWDAYVRAINDTGGIAGRKVAPHYISYDPLDFSSYDTACTAAASDAKAFAVLDLGAFQRTGPACVTERYGLPLLAVNNVPEDVMQAAGGLALLSDMNQTRAARNAVGYFDQLGELQGRTIGIVADSGNPTLGDAVQQTLEQLGYNVAARTDYSSDLSVAASQTPLEVQKQLRAGVNYIFFAVASNIILESYFTRQASTLAWHPQYRGPDTADVGGTTSPRDQWQNYRAAGTQLTRADPPPPRWAECQSLYQTATGRGVDWTQADASVSVIRNACESLWLIFRPAASAAGENLTPQSFSSAVQQLGDHGGSVVIGGGAFRPGKFEAADLVRGYRYDFDGCQCYVPVADFVPARF